MAGNQFAYWMQFSVRYSLVPAVVCAFDVFLTAAVMQVLCISTVPYSLRRAVQPRSVGEEQLFCFDFDSNRGG